MRITPEDFLGKILDLNQATTRERLQRLIDVEAPIFLEKLLGLEVATKVIEGDIDYRDVANLIFKPVSPIVNYVFCEWLRVHSSSNSPAGEVINKVETAANTTSYHKQVHEWNEMVSKNKRLIEYINQKGLSRCRPDIDLINIINIYGI